MKSLKNNF